jgi:putative oxidoreductase
MFAKLKAVRSRILSQVERLGPLGPLLARITVGVVFMGTGWGKLHSLGDVTTFFTELHIPFPGFNAALTATTEFVGGLCLLLGLGTRLAAPPLAFTMVIALLTAKRDSIEGFSSLLGMEEFLYLTLFVWLAVAGAGKASIDHFIAKKLAGPPGPKLEPHAAT